ncbi:MAG: cellulase family glycosylhydrolase [Chitinispirillaceae bacterium]|nr:cellulase family glycosylhydrolase [Chitinispirillaceae bacterium]
MILPTCLKGIVIVLAAAAAFIEGAQPPATIHYNGKEFYINGINVPWNSFGSDMGTHYQWGALYSSSFFDTFFRECGNFGVNCVRLWIHCDGRTSPEFDDNGYVTGLDDNFLSDFDDILEIAATNDVMVMPCLWSFDMTKDFTSTAGKYAGMHADLIQDSGKTRSYINNALIPMVSHLDGSCNLFAWEIINEPEWSIEGPGNTAQLVSAEEMVRFCAMIAEAIHLNSRKMVTVGAACLKWCSPRQPPAEAHYWCDSSLKAAYNKPQAVLDFYQIHYYDWMFNVDWGYDPFQQSKTPAYWKLDKPALIGESPAAAGKYTMKQMVDSAFAHGYAGIMPWSYNADDGVGGWDACKTELKAFRDAHPSLVDFDCGAAVIGDARRKSSRRPPRPLVDFVNNASPEMERVEIFDVQGNLVRSHGLSDAGSALPRMGEGVYVWRVVDRHNRVVFSSKSIIAGRTGLK